MKRVLVWGMSNNKGGTEAVINNLVALAPKDVVFDFLAFEQLTNWPQIRLSGGESIILPNKRTNFQSYERAIKAFFRSSASRYDAVWTNLNILNNIDSLRLGCKYGIGRTILHAHNSVADGNLHQRVLCALNKPIFENYITDRWACSPQAGVFFFGSKPFKVIPNAIDMQRFAYSSQAREKLRDELGLNGKYVIGTVGNLVYQKNQKLLIRYLPAVLEKNPDTQLVLVGSGPLEKDLRNQALNLGVAQNVTFLGQRPDVPALLSAFDVFAFPSHFEGFSVALLEAQANGLPCVISSTIPDDPIVSEGCSVVDLGHEAAWVESLLYSSRDKCRLIPSKASQYDLDTQADTLKGLFAW